MATWLNGKKPCKMCMARGCDCGCPTCAAAREQRERDGESAGTTLGKALIAAMASGRTDGE